MGGGHEGGGLLMASQDELDRRFADGFDDIEILFARDAEDAIDALILEGGNKQV
jgi:hypothetical protein